MTFIIFVQFTYCPAQSNGRPLLSPSKPAMMLMYVAGPGHTSLTGYRWEIEAPRAPECFCCDGAHLSMYTLICLDRPGIHEMMAPASALCTAT